MDSNITGWDTSGTTSPTHNVADGYPLANGSLQVSSVPGPGQFTISIYSACATLMSSTNYSVGLWKKQTVGTPPNNGCAMVAEVFATGDCSGASSSFGLNTSNLTSSWSVSANDFTTLGSTNSARVAFNCDSSTSYTLLVDNAFFIPGTGSLPVTLQSFEIQ